MIPYLQVIIDPGMLSGSLLLENMSYPFLGVELATFLDRQDLSTVQIVEPVSKFTTIIAPGSGHALAKETTSIS